MALTLIVTTAAAIGLAMVMGVMAWRLSRDERRRSEARVAALASDIRFEPARGASEPRVAPAHRLDIDDLDLRPAPAAPVGELFRTEPSRSGSRLAAVLATGIFAVLLALAFVVASGGERVESSAAVAPRLTPEAPAGDAALELIALGHDRDGDRLTVRGIVRNAGTARTGDVAAVVFLFDRDGGFLSSGRAAIETPALAPGAESPFIVTVSHAENVGRYRVSFRSGDRVVPHVDRRNPGPIAQLK